MSERRSYVDPQTGRMVVEQKGWTHPFYRPGLDDVGRVSAKITAPLQQSVWVFRAIQWIAGPIAQAELVLTMDRRGGEVPYEDPETARFLNCPARNRLGLMSRYDFIEATVAWIALEGRAAWILDDSWLTPSGIRNPLMIADPRKLRAVTDQDGDLLGWTLTKKNGDRASLLPEQVRLTKSFNMGDDFTGVAPMESARLAAETDLAAGTFAKSLMDNNGDTGPIVSTKGGGVLSTEQVQQITHTLRQKRIQSRRGDFRPVFLSGDIEVHDPTTQSVDEGFIRQRVETRHEVGLAFGLPMSYFDIVAAYSVGSASDRFKAMEETIMPQAVRIAESLEHVLAARDGGASSAAMTRDRDVYVAFSFDDHSTMQKVREEKYEAATKLWDRGISWRVLNETFGLNLPEFPGWEEAYVPFSLSAVTSGEAAQAETPPEEEEDEIEESMERLTDLFLCRAHSRAPEEGEEGEEGEEELPPIDPERRAMWERHLQARAPWLKRFRSRFGRHLTEARRETLERLNKLYPKKGLDVTTRIEPIDLTFDLPQWLRDFLAGMAQVQANAMEAAALELLKHELDRPAEDFTLPAEAVREALSQRRNYLANAGTQIWTDVQEAIRAGMEKGESIEKLSGRVREAFNGIDSERATTIAVTETSAAYEAGRMETFRQSGIQYKEWLSSQDDRVRKTHRMADGQVRKMDDYFELPGGIRLMHPAQSGGPPQEVINCRCVSIASKGPKPITPPNS